MGYARELARMQAADRNQEVTVGRTVRMLNQQSARDMFPPGLDQQRQTFFNTKDSFNQTYQSGIFRKADLASTIQMKTSTDFSG